MRTRSKPLEKDHRISEKTKFENKGFPSKRDQRRAEKRANRSRTTVGIKTRSKPSKRDLRIEERKANRTRQIEKTQHTTRKTPQSLRSRSKPLEKD